MLLLTRDDDDEEFDYTIQTPAHKTLEVKVPRETMRLIIGRNGRNIRNIQETSNTKIRFRDLNENETVCMLIITCFNFLHSFFFCQVCVIRGLPDSCLLAKQLIDDLIVSQPILESIDVWVPQNVVGKIIGRCGERINEISTVSGAKINVSDVGKNEATRRIVIKGR